MHSVELITLLLPDILDNFDLVRARNLNETLLKPKFLFKSQTTCADKMYTLQCTLKG